MGGAPIKRPLFFFFCGAHFLSKIIMGEVPIEFALFSACSQQFVLVKLPEVGFYKIMGEAPIFRPSVFFFLKRPFSPKKNHGRCAHDAPISFFYSAHDPYIPTPEELCSVVGGF